MKRRKPHKMHPLSEEQKQFAKKHNYLIYSFLCKYNYSIEEFYDIAAIGYIRACQKYLETEELHKFPFPAIATMTMKTEIGNYFASKIRKCRKPENGIVSIEQFTYENGSPCIEIPSNDIGILESIVQTEEDNIFMNKVLNLLSELQGYIVVSLLNGYKEREIYTSLKIPRKTYRNELSTIKDILRQAL